MKQQNGFSHLLAIVIIVVVVGVVGFAAFLVSNRSNEPVASKNKVTANDAAEKANTDVPSTKETEQAKPVAEQTPAPAAQTTPQAASQKRTITFTKGGGSQQGNVVKVSANLSESVQGTCTYKFSLNGSIRVQKTSGVSNGDQCFIEVPVSAFPKSATYSMSLSFVSSDGLVSASQAPYDIAVN